MSCSSVRKRSANLNSTEKLRAACDKCHQGKSKCSGGQPCETCAEAGRPCVYSQSNRLGRPKGSKNKRPADSNSNPDQQASSSGSSINSTQNQQTPPDNNTQAHTANPTNTLDDVAMSILSEDLTSPGYLQTTDMDFANLLDSFGAHAGEGKEAQGVTGTTPDISRMSADQSRAALFNYGHPYPSPHTLGDFSNIQQTTVPSEVLPNSMSPEFTAPQSVLPPSAIQSITELLRSSSTENSQASSTVCTCVNSHIRLLFQVDKIEQLQMQCSSPDVALIGARQAMDLYDRLAKCANCRSGGNDGAFVIFALTLRFILRALKQASTKTFATGASPTMPLQTVQNSEDLSWRAQVGRYEAFGDERNMVAHALLVMAVKRIEGSLPCLTRRLRQRRGSDGAELSPWEDLGNADRDQNSYTIGGFEQHIDQVLRNIEHILQYR